MMKWKQIDPYHAQSDTGFRVSRTGTEPPRYSVWAPPGKATKPLTTTAEGYGLLGIVRSFQQAKQLCEENI